MTTISTSAARQLAGQLIMIRFPGTVLDADTRDFIRANSIRAVCLFRGNMLDAVQLSQLTRDLREAMGEDALIAIDQEGGAVVRATWLPAPPAALALGAADDVALAREVGAAVARGVKSLGFNWNFAPVLDLNNNLNNPVIAERSFGLDPQRASELALAWMQGSLDEGVACCVKHAPGHGDTHVDSHRDLPTVDKPLAALQALEFTPFKLASPHAPAMMTAHIVYPALDAELPATLSPRILTGLIRDEWQFDGVVITDGMDMHAIAGRYGVGQAAVQSLLAGTDMVMALGNRETQQATLAALTECIASGAISNEKLQQKLERLRALAQRYPLPDTDIPASAQLQTYSSAQEQQDRELMRRAWQAALTAYGQPVPPAPGSAIRVVVKKDASSDGVSEAGLSAQKLQAWLATHFDVALSTFESQEDLIWSELPQDGRRVILASTSRIRYGAHACQSWKPDLHLCLWNPFQALDIAAPALVTYGFAEPALQALGEWFHGRRQASGRNPCLPDRRLFCLINHKNAPVCRERM